MEPATLLELLHGRARATPDRPAFRFGGEDCTWERLWGRAEDVASLLMRRRLGRGDRVVVALPNGVDFFAAFYGVQLAGGVAVPIFDRSGEDRIETIARLCGAAAVLSGSGGPAGGPASTPRCPRLAVPGRLEAGTRPPADLPAVGPQDLAYLQYTSGSTGEPKGVEIRQIDLLTNVRQMIAGFDITEDDVFVSWLPAYHDMGLVLMTMVPFYLGARLVLLPTRLGRGRPWLAAIGKHRATFTAAPDFAYRVCLRYAGDPRRHDLSSLRVALDAAEPVRAATLSEFERAYGLRRVMVPAYGLAEATVGVTGGRAGAAPRIDRRGFVSVGRPFPGIEIAILRDGETAPPGEVGEILVRSPANTRGYYADPEATVRLLRDDGYLHTGDLGYLDGDGELFVVGRQKNIIIHGGRNLAPKEVEEIVETLAPVRRAAAVGIDRGGPEGEQLYAFAELRGAGAGDREAHRDLAIEIVDRVHRQLGLRPARVYLLAPGSIPLTPNGKIRHPDLKRRHASGELRADGRILFPEF